METLRSVIALCGVGTLLVGCGPFSSNRIYLLKSGDPSQNLSLSGPNAKGGGSIGLVPLPQPALFQPRKDTQVYWKDSGNNEHGKAPRDLALGLLDSDGFLDVVTADYVSNDSRRFLGQGDGTFIQNDPLFNTAGNGSDAVAMGNFNIAIDTNLDVAIASRDSQSVTVLMGDGNGGFLPGTCATQSSCGPANPYRVGSLPESIVSADMDNDGNPELITAGGNNTITVLYGTGNTSAPFNDCVAVPCPDSKDRIDIQIKGYTLNAVVVGNLNSNVDSYKDIVVIGTDNFDGSSEIAVLRGTGHRDNSYIVYYLETGPNPRGVVLGDIDADGDLDIITANENTGNRRGSISILKNTGNFTFSPHVDYDAGAATNSVDVGDLNGDLLLDIAAANHDKEPSTGRYTVSAFLQNSDGTFARSDFEAATEPRSIKVGRMDSNSSFDLVVANEGDNSISTFLNTNP